MATGRERQLTKQIGEYLVSAELYRLGFVATTFTGSNAVAINDKHETKPIQVKTIRGGNWQFNNVRRFLDISISNNGIQTIIGKKDIPNPNLICIFVKLISQGKDEFYVISSKDLQEIIFKGHREWFEKHGGRRPRNPKSMHTAVSPEDLSKYRDKESMNILYSHLR